MRDATPNPVSFLRKQETKHPSALAASWVPAFAGMTPGGGKSSVAQIQLSSGRSKRGSLKRARLPKLPPPRAATSLRS